MQCSCTNIYQAARNTADLTQLSAAESLLVSPRSLSDYETGKTPVPDDVACRMIEIYGVPWLAYEHLRQSTKVGQRFLPEILHTDLAKSVLKLQKEVGDLKPINADMIEIACDGTIEEHEMRKWDHIKKELRDIAGAALSLVFAK